MDVLFRGVRGTKGGVSHAGHGTAKRYFHQGHSAGAGTWHQHAAPTLSHILGGRWWAGRSHKVVVGGAGKQGSEGFPSASLEAGKGVIAGKGEGCHAGTLIPEAEDGTRYAHASARGSASAVSSSVTRVRRGKVRNESPSEEIREIRGEGGGGSAWQCAGAVEQRGGVRTWGARGTASAAPRQKPEGTTDFLRVSECLFGGGEGCHCGQGGGRRGRHAASGSRGRCRVRARERTWVRVGGFEQRDAGAERQSAYITPSGEIRENRGEGGVCPAWQCVRAVEQRGGVRTWGAQQRGDRRSSTDREGKGGFSPLSVCLFKIAGNKGA